MVYAGFIKVSKVLMSSEVVMNELLILTTKTMPRKGVKVLGKVLEFFNEHPNDFTKDVVTVRLTAIIYRAPRIVTKQRHKRVMRFRLINKFYR